MGASLSALLPLPAPAASQVSVQVLESDPVSPAVLGHWENLYLRIGYASDQPIRIHAVPYFQGQPVSGPTGGAPSLDAGSGETLLWFAFVDAHKVDSITVFAETPKGKLLAQTSLPVDLTWTGVPADTKRVVPEWVTRMSAEQQSRIKAHDNDLMNRPVWYLVAGFMMMAVPGYFAVQGWVLCRLHDSWRKPALLPLWPMGAVLAYTVYACLDGSNLFPLVLIFTAPIAFLYLVVLLAKRRSAQRVA